MLRPVLQKWMSGNLSLDGISLIALLLFVLAALLLKEAFSAFRSASSS